MQKLLCMAFFPLAILASQKKNVSLARLWHMLAKEHVWCCSESHNREVSCLGNMSTIIACEKGALAFFTPWRKMLLCLCYIVQA